MRRITPYSRMVALLKEEQEALLTGRLELLEQIVSRKEHAAARLAGAALSKAELNRLTELSTRNGTLLKIAADAICAVRSLAENAGTAPETLAYSADGLRHPLNASARQLTQKV